MQRLYLSLFNLAIICIVNSAWSQSVSTLIGGRTAGMANASVALTDSWGLFNNVAGVADLKQPSIVTAYDAHPKLEGADRSALALSFPMKIGTFSAGIYQFGDAVYNEQKLSIGFANQLGLASLGLSANYIQYRTAQFGTKGVITINFGGIAKLTEKLFIGAHIQNINQPQLSETTKERVPTRLAVGIRFNPSGKVILVTEIEKDLDYDAICKVGLEYVPVKKFAVRTGFNLRPSTLFTGVGFVGKRLFIDYAYQYNPVGLADSHQASLGYKLTTL